MTVNLVVWSMAAPIRRKTASELYTATREAERLYAKASEALSDGLEQFGQQVEAPTVQYIKKCSGVMGASQNAAECAAVIKDVTGRAKLTT